MIEKVETPESDQLPNGQACRRRSCVAHLVMEAAAVNPGAPALVSGSETLAYGELIARASRMASYLVGLGIEADVPVALCLDRSFDLIISAFAILLAGGAYLPLDPDWPPARLSQILKDADARFLITRDSIGNFAQQSGVKVIDLEPANEAVFGSEPLPEPVPVTRENLAYIIYTSGSTGQPKGVEVTHGNLLNLIFWHRRFFEITAADRATHLAGLAFDAAVWEIWPNLTAGATLVLAGQQTRTSPDLLRDWLVKQRITVAFVPTVLAEPLFAQEWPAQKALRYLLTGGDKLHGSPSASFSATVVNNYGPTECTVVATSGTVAPRSERDRGSGLAPSIGKPIAHTQIYILDEHGSEVSEGETGEIYVGGTGVARGYRNSSAATAERFLPDPFSKVPGARLYRTGDLGFFLPDGQIAFCGRVDAQVEVHGHRIEPEEIVSVLNRHPGVLASAVVARGECCSKRLAAYVVPRAGAELSAADLREFVGTYLPQYMIPATFSHLEALPLNFNGKLDREALPDPGPENMIRDAGYRTPDSSTEEQLARILAGLLGVARVGADDNFFLLGLHSLLATQVASRVYEHFGVQLTPRHLFEAKTVARLAAEVDRLLEARLDALSDEEVSRLLAS